MFRVIDPGVIRAVTHPDLLRLPPLPRLSGEPSQQVDPWLAWMTQVWAHPWVAEAIEIASPDLARDIDRLQRGQRPRPQDARRMVVSLSRYLLRVTSRPTPFGIFAGATAVCAGSTPTARIGDSHTTTTRAEAAWLDTVITELEALPTLMAAVPVIANNLAFARGAKLVLGGHQHLDAAGRDKPVEITVANTAPVQLALRTAQTPISLRIVGDKVSAAFPAVPRAKVDAMLLNLVKLRVLVSSLHPPATAPDPLDHLIEQLTAHGGQALAEVAPVLDRLKAIHAALADLDALPPDAYEHRSQLRRTITQTSRLVSPTVPQRLAVTQRLDAEIMLPETVHQAATLAAATLMRLAPRHGSAPAWQHYHGRFVERYGPDTLVPVIELINPNTGLGFPAGFRDGPDEPASAVTERDRALLDIAQRAALSRSTAVTLTDEQISEIGREPQPHQLPPHTEISFQLHAADIDAVAAGRFCLAVATLTRHVGTLTGRFLPGFRPADRRRITDAYAAAPTIHSGSVAAQLICDPMYALAGNVARVPVVLPRTIAIGQHPIGPESISLEDLAVGATADHLYLVQQSTRRLVEPTTLNALELRNFTHPVTRFLAEIYRWHTTTPSPFAWGAASSLPFLPRMTYQRAILSPAQWRLHRTDLPERSRSWTVWDEAFVLWRRAHLVPERVLLGDTDVVVCLDLTNTAHRELLRDHLDRQPTAVLREVAPSHAYGWLHGRTHEIVLPLAPDRPQPEPSFSVPSRQRTATRRDSHLPGAGDWLYAKLYAPNARHRDILTGGLTSLWVQTDPPLWWWFIRYNDPEPHIRLRFRLRDPAAYGDAANRVGRWARRLRDAGLADRLELATYHPEIGRYGAQPATVDAAHRLFDADSAAAITQLAARHIDPLALTAASMTAIATGLIGDHTSAMRWLLNHIPRSTTPAAATRPSRHQALTLANPADSWAALRDRPFGEETAQRWTRRERALREYARLLAADDGAPSLDAVLASLLHMHHVRVAGLDPAAELNAHHLARAIALRHLQPAAGHR